MSFDNEFINPMNSLTHEFIHVLTQKVFCECLLYARHVFKLWGWGDYNRKCPCPQGPKHVGGGRQMRKLNERVNMEVSADGAMDGVN